MHIDFIYKNIINVNPIDKISSVDFGPFLMIAGAIIMVILIIKASTSKNPGRNIFIAVVASGVLVIILTTMANFNYINQKKNDVINSIVKTSSTTIEYIEDTISPVIAVVG